jgi:hypothetical protein
MSPALAQRKTRSRRVALAIGLALLAAAAIAYAAPPRDGLFNNEAEDDRALREHLLAWRQHNPKAAISRLDLLALERTYGGACLTDEPNWSAVKLDTLTDPELVERKVAISCFYHVRARGPRGLLTHHLWTLTLVPVDRNQFEVVRINRASRGLDL